ncbi:hypothetical protein LEP1GSC066_1347 [Leptospira sp. serovar Kenya str. Sh9]|nr:hypothetical protein LEP1GSC066_1347 [Leptospira sp. serovar Kenya str. Sh9]
MLGAYEPVGMVVLIEDGKKTILSNSVLYESKEDRDGVLTSGMEKGLEISYDRFVRNVGFDLKKQNFLILFRNKQIIRKNSILIRKNPFRLVLTFQKEI